MYTIDKVLRRVPQHGDAVPTQQGSPCANHALNASMSSVRDFVLESGAARARPVDASPLDVCRSASSHFMSLCSSALRVRRAVTTKLRGRRGSTKVCVARAFDPQNSKRQLNVPNAVAQIMRRQYFIVDFEGCREGLCRKQNPLRVVHQNRMTKEHTLRHQTLSCRAIARSSCSRLLLAYGFPRHSATAALALCMGDHTNAAQDHTALHHAMRLQVRARRYNYAQGAIQHHLTLGHAVSVHGHEPKPVQHAPGHVAQGRLPHTKLHVAGQAQAAGELALLGDEPAAAPTPKDKGPTAESSCGARNNRKGHVRVTFRKLWQRDHGTVKWVIRSHKSMVMHVSAK